MADRRGAEGRGEDGGLQREATVLVVDDEDRAQESVAQALGEIGYTVLTADRADEGLALLDDDVDIVLLDRRLPDADGENVVASMRAHDADCRIALVTAAEPDFDVLEIDCDDYLVKPVDRAALVETVDRLALLAAYDETRRELSSLRVRRNVLEVEKEADELADGEELPRLDERITALEAELADLTAEFDDQLGYDE